MFKKAAQQEVVALQGGDKESMHAWGIICEISRRAYQEIYDLLDIKIEERGESFYNSLLPTIVSDLESKSLVTISEGAKCLFLEGFQNREGEPLPSNGPEIGWGLQLRHHRYGRHLPSHCERKSGSVDLRDRCGQSQHFRMIFKAAEKAGYLDPEKSADGPCALWLGPRGRWEKIPDAFGRNGTVDRSISASDKASDRILEQRTPEMAPEERHQ